MRVAPGHARRAQRSARNAAGHGPALPVRPQCPPSSAFSSLTSEAAASGANKKRKAPKLSKNHKLVEMPLEVKLSDELADSLRLLRPEGNLAKERFRSLQERGLIEPRVPAVKKRKYAPKVTEKWSYKDIKL